MILAIERRNLGRLNISLLLLYTVYVMVWASFYGPEPNNPDPITSPRQAQDQ